MTVARWESDRLSLAASGGAATLPHLIRGPLPVPFAAAVSRETVTAEPETRPGDLLFLVSSGLAALRFPSQAVPAEKCVQQVARAAEGQPLPAAFAQVVSEWKRAGGSPSGPDVLLLAARRL